MIKVFADTASVSEMVDLASQVDGFTTNPSLMRKAGVVDYLKWAKEVVATFPTTPISFEVVSDAPEGILREAKTLSSLGPFVYVKVPLRNEGGYLNKEVVGTLLREGVPVNLTLVFDVKDLDYGGMMDALDTDTPAIVSVFAGRVKDTGREVPYVKGWRNVEFLWASTRGIHDLVEAEGKGFDIITIPPSILEKRQWLGVDLRDIERVTLAQFYRDVKEAGYTI